MGLNKKSQQAMEFLMTYGWAIILILVLIGALAYFGTFNDFNNNMIRNQKDREAMKLCDNLKVNDMLYPQYEVKIDEMVDPEYLQQGWIYIVESANLKDNQPRIAKTGLKDNPYKWTGDLDEIKTVWCIIPAEICHATKGITRCSPYLDRMEFNYSHWKQWYDLAKKEWW